MRLLFTQEKKKLNDLKMVVTQPPKTPFSPPKKHPFWSKAPYRHPRGVTPQGHQRSKSPMKKI